MRFGLDAKPLGQPRMMDDEPHVAAEILFNTETLERLRTSFRITGPVVDRLFLNTEQAAAA